MMTQQFNLISEQWIPVTYCDGSTGTVGWRDLIANSSNIIDVSTDPVHIYGIVLRLATAIFLRTQGAPLGNPSSTAWQEWGEGRLEKGVDVEALDEYLEKWSDRFWLIDDTHPFLQDPAIATECTERTSTNKLFFDVASGNNPLWWTKIADDYAGAVPFARAAMALLGQWGYAAGGRCTTRNGIANSKQAPERQFSQFIPRGYTLLETLLMCCTPADGDSDLAIKDAPIWELEPSDVPVLGQLGRLTASTRGLLLFANSKNEIELVVSTWSKWTTSKEYKDKKNEEFWNADVFMAKQVTGKKVNPFKLSISSVAWRDFPSIMASQTDDGTSYISPTALDPARNPLGKTDVFFRSGVTVLTHFADKSKDIGWSRSELPGVLAAGPAKDPAAFFRISQFCKIVDKIVFSVKRSVVRKAESKKDYQDFVMPDGEMFVQQLWLDAEDKFRAVLHGEPWEEASRWLIRRYTKRFDEAVAGVEVPQRLAATFRTRQLLIRQFKKITKDFGLDESEVVL